MPCTTFRENPAVRRLADGGVATIQAHEAGASGRNGSGNLHVLTCVIGLVSL